MLRGSDAVCHFAAAFRESGADVHRVLPGVDDIGAWLAQRCYDRVERMMLAPGKAPAPVYPQPTGTSLLERPWAARLDTWVPHGSETTMV